MNIGNIMIVVIILKAFGLINLPWIVVFSPLIVLAVVFLGAVVVTVALPFIHPVRSYLRRRAHARVKKNTD